MSEVDTTITQQTAAQDRERAYTAGWRAFVNGIGVSLATINHPGLGEFVRKGWEAAERASKVRNVYWSKR